MNSSSPFQLFGSGRAIVTLAEAYLLLPVIMWVAAWFIWPISVPVCAGLLWVLIRHASVRDEEGQGACLRPVRVSGFVICVLIAAAYTFITGFDGRLYQSWDFMVRNAIYDELVQNPWPLIKDQGYFVPYSLQYWLPPALLASWFPAAQVQLLQLWYFIGILLVMLLMLQHFGGKRLVLFNVFLILISPLCFAFNATHRICWLPSIAADCTSTFHFFVLTMLMLSLYVREGIPFRRLLFCSALLFVSAPLSSLFFAPLMLWRAWTEMRDQQGILRVSRLLKLPELWFGGLSVLLSLIVYGSNSGSHISLVFSSLSQTYTGAIAISQKFFLASILLIGPPYVIYLITKEKFTLYIMGYGVFFLLVTVTGDNNLNEALYKFSTAYGFFIAYFLIKHIRCRQIQFVAVCLIAVSLPNAGGTLVKGKKLGKALESGFAVQECNIRNEWEGTLDHPENMDAKKYLSPDFSHKWMIRHGELLKKKEGAQDASGE